MPELNKELSCGWLRACDEAMTSLHIGVANLSDSYVSAKEKLRTLINLHITIATDPTVNGGYKLVPIETGQPANTSHWLIRKEPNTKDTYYVAEGTPPDNVLEVYGITKGVKQ